jgi:hypothetical protein
MVGAADTDAVAADADAVAVSAAAIMHANSNDLFGLPYCAILVIRVIGFISPLLRKATFHFKEAGADSVSLYQGP